MGRDATACTVYRAPIQDTYGGVAAASDRDIGYGLNSGRTLWMRRSKNGVEDCLRSCKSMVFVGKVSEGTRSSGRISRPTAHQHKIGHAVKFTDQDSAGM